MLNFQKLLSCGIRRGDLAKSMHPTFAQAILIFTALLAASPCHPVAYAACTGSSALEAKLHARADADTYKQLGNWFGDRKQYPCALEAFQNALNLEPGSAELHYLVGLTLYASGHPEAALKPLGQSIYLMPEVLKPHLLLAAALEKLQRPQEAQSEWASALRIDPVSVEALDGMSKSLMAQGDYVSAIELLREAPHNDTLTLDLALAYGKSRCSIRRRKFLRWASNGTRRLWR